MTDQTDTPDPQVDVDPADVKDTKVPAVDKGILVTEQTVTRYTLREARDRRDMAGAQVEMANSQVAATQAQLADAQGMVDDAEKALGL